MLRNRKVVFCLLFLLYAALFFAFYGMDAHFSPHGTTRGHLAQAALDWFIVIVSNALAQRVAALIKQDNKEKHE